MPVIEKYKKHDYYALAEKLEYLFAHPEECKRMGENGFQKYLEELTLRKLEERMVEILDLCVGKKG